MLTPEKKKRLLAALRAINDMAAQTARQRKIVAETPVAPSEASALLALVRKIEEMSNKGDRGDPGPMGLRGLPGKDGKNGKDGKDGRDGVDGRDGKDGRDGIDGEVDMDELRGLCREFLQAHEKQFDHTLLHDPKQLGTLTLDESTVADGKIFQVRDGKIVCTDLPKQQAVPYFARGGSSSTKRRQIKDVTSSQTIDPLDDVIHIDASAGDITLTFYSAQGQEGNSHYIKRVDDSENAVTVALTGAETWEFELSDSLPNRGSGREVYAHNGNWFLKHA